MNNQNQIILISSLNDLCLIKKSFGFYEMPVSKSNPLKREAVFKCKKDVTISEVFGYLLARLIGVPVADFLAIWFDKEVNTPKGNVISANQVAILIEYLPELKKISLEDVTLRDKALAAKILTLRLFDRYEWPEEFSSAHSVIVLDLERIGPIMTIYEFTPDSIGSIKRNSLKGRKEEYSGLNTTRSAYRVVLSKVEELGISKEFQIEISKLSRISKKRIRRDLFVSGHPFSHQLSVFFQSAISRRLAIFTSEMGMHI